MRYKTFKYFFLIVGAILSSFLVEKGIAQSFQINVVPPEHVSPCQPSDSFVITIWNKDSVTLSGILLKANTPVGSEYVPGSVTYASEHNISNLEVPWFLVPDILPGDTHQFHIRVLADCGIVPYQNSGQDLVLQTVGYHPQDTVQGSDLLPFNLLIPNLIIDIDSNQIGNAWVDSVYVRKISILNTGFGSSNGFYILEQQTSGGYLTFDSASIGQVGDGLGVDTLWLSGADFTTIGNGDSLFDTYEEIIIYTYHTVSTCQNVQSKIRVGWGCDLSFCQSTFEPANIIVNWPKPQLSYYKEADKKTCVGAGEKNEHFLRINNSGTAPARNLRFRIWKYYGGQLSKIDPLSFQYKIGENGVLINDTAIINSYESPNACVTSIAPSVPNANNVDFIYDSLGVGDTIFIYFDTYNCCPTLSCNTNNQNISVRSDYLYYRVYFNQGNCSQTITDLSQWFLYHGNQMIFNTSSMIMPQANDSDSVVFNIRVNNLTNRYTDNANKVMTAEFETTNCFYWNGNLTDIYWQHANGVSRKYPFEATQVGNKIIAKFSDWYVSNSTIHFKLWPDCGNPLCNLPFFSFTLPDNEWGYVPYNLQMFYVNDTTCSNPCDMQVNCRTDSVFMICPSPGPCPLSIISSEMTRVNYGSPDNDDDGIADTIGSLDFDKVRTDLVMAGDTFKQDIKGIFYTTDAHPSIPRSFWTHVFGESDVNNGAYFESIIREIDVYDRSTGVLHECFFDEEVIPGSQNNTHINRFFSGDSLLGCTPSLPPGFVYENLDSIHIREYFLVDTNIGSDGLQTAPFVNTYYVSDSSDVNYDTAKYICLPFMENIEVIGYEVSKSMDIADNLSFCSNFGVTHSLSFKVGPVEDGGNYFPFEHRNFLLADTLLTTVPTSISYLYNFSNVNQYRTSGPDQSTTTTVSVSPQDSLATPLLFDLKALYQSNGGPLVDPDEGFRLTLGINYGMDCSAPLDYPDIATHQMNLTPSNEIWAEHPNPQTAFKDLNGTDPFTTLGPELNLNVQLPELDFSPNPVWNFSYVNDADVNAHFAWILIFNNSGNLVMDNLIDIGSGDTLMPENGGYYYVGDIAANTSKSYRLESSLEGCFRDSIFVYSGYACDTFPLNFLDALSCQIPKQDTLFVKRQPEPEIQMIVQGPTERLPLCDTSYYNVTVVNVGEKPAFNMKMIAEFSQGLVVIPNLSLYKYPDSVNYTTLFNPVQNGLDWEWDLSGANIFDGKDTLGGYRLDPDNKFRVRVGVVTDCDYESDSIIGFRIESSDSCGNPLEDTYYSALSFRADTATKSYDNAMYSMVEPLNPCSDGSTVHVGVVPSMANLVDSNDRIVITLPSYVSYVMGSYDSIHNSMNHQDPEILTYGNTTELTWYLPDTLYNLGDSIVFEFEVNGLPDSLACDTPMINFRAIEEVSFTCPATFKTCTYYLNNGNLDLELPVERSDFNFAYAMAFIDSVSGNDEVIQVSVGLENLGQTVTSSNDVTINLYQDNDQSGGYSVGDALMESVLIQTNIFSGDTLEIDTSLVLNSLSGCNILLVIEDANNVCVCSGNRFEQSIDLGFNQIINLPNQEICEGDSVFIDNSQFNGNYQFGWLPGEGLSNDTIASPWIQNLVDTLDSVNYVLEINRNGCLYYDSIQVIRFPGPEAVSVDTIFVCETDTILFANAPLNPSVGTWTLIDVSNIIIADSSNPTSLITNVEIGTVNIEWAVQNDACPIVRDTTTIIKEAFPFITPVDTFICSSDSIILPLETGFPDYEYEWIPNVFLNDSSYANPIVYNTLDSLDSLVYIVNVTSNGCTKKDTILVEMVPSPLASSIDTVFVCETSAILSANNIVPPSTGVWTYLMGQGLDIDSINDPNTMINNVDTGVHYLSWTIDNSFCSSAADTTTVIREVFPKMLVNDTFLCSTDSIIMPMSGNFNGFSFEWNTLQGITDSLIADPIIFNEVDTLDSVFYQVNIESNGCLKTDSIVVLRVPSPMALLQDTIFVCEDTITVLANQPVSPNQGTWNQISGSMINVQSPNQEQTFLQGLGVGHYQLTWSVTNNYCPQAEDTLLLVRSPFSDIVEDSVVICYPNSINLELDSIYSNYQYAWNPDTFITDTSMANPNLINTMNVLDTIVYYVNMEYQQCTSRDSIYVLLVPTSTAESIDTIIICQEDTLLNAQLPIYPAMGYWETLAGDTITIDSIQDPYSLVNNIGVGTHYIWWKVDNNYCTNSEDTTILIRKPYMQSDAGPDILICKQQELFELQAVSFPETQTGYWSSNPADGVLALEDSVMGVVSGQGLADSNYQFVWTLYDDICPTVRDTMTLVVSPYYYAAFDLDTNAYYTDHYVVMYDQSLNAALWYWDFGDDQSTDLQNTAHIYTEPGNYTIQLLITDSNGCLDSATKSIEVVEDLIVPNVFSPNGDGINDVFHIVASGMSTYKVSIFNRWGNLMFEQESPKIKWDGRNRSGQLCSEGIYYFVVEAESYNGETYKKEGYVHLLR